MGNLPWSATEEDVAGLFAELGEVLSVRVVADRETGRSRGFAFVELEDAVADVALEREFEIEGRGLRINEAQERAPRGGGGFGGSRGGPRGGSREGGGFGGGGGGDYGDDRPRGGGRRGGGGGGGRSRY